MFLKGFVLQQLPRLLLTTMSTTSNVARSNSSSGASKAVVSLKIVSDIVWPFCFVGLRNLEAAVAKSGVPVRLEWEPFLLNANMPDEGEPILEHLKKKYGESAAKRFGDANSPLRRSGRAVGIKFTNDRNAYPTIRAHSLIEAVKEEYDNDKANELMEIMYRSYFENGENINDVEKLADLAEKVGVDKRKAVMAIISPELHQKVKSKDQQYKMMQIPGVPFFIIEQNNGDQPVAFSGAQPADMIAEVLDKASETGE